MSFIRPSDFFLAEMNVKIDESWQNVLQPQFETTYFKELTEFVRAECQNYKCFPPGRQIFSAFNNCKFEDLKVVIIGQDPYHGPGQANGLCFSVTEGTTHPPSEFSSAS